MSLFPVCVYKHICFSLCMMMQLTLKININLSMHYFCKLNSFPMQCSVYIPSSAFTDSWFFWIFAQYSNKWVNYLFLMQFFLICLFFVFTEGQSFKYTTSSIGMKSSPRRPDLEMTLRFNSLKGKHWVWNSYHLLKVSIKDNLISHVALSHRDEI